MAQLTPQDLVAASRRLVVNSRRLIGIAQELLRQAKGRDAQARNTLQAVGLAQTLRELLRETSRTE